MKTRTRLVTAIGAALWLIPAVQALAGIDFTAGDWKVDISGNVNAFYVGAGCDDGPPSQTLITGGLACTGSDSAAVRNGLLPAALVFSATSRQGDLDVGVTIGLYPGINSSAAAGVNEPACRQHCRHPASMRQAFFTFGDASWGLGEDGPRYRHLRQGCDPRRHDPARRRLGRQQCAPGNTSLAASASATSTPTGFRRSRIRRRISAASTSAPASSSRSTRSVTPVTPHDAPQFQAGVNYAWGDTPQQGLTGKSGWTSSARKPRLAADRRQRLAPTPASPAFWDAGIKVGIGGFEGVLYGYTGSGIGTTGL
jgi:hypothetical protein